MTVIGGNINSQGTSHISSTNISVSFAPPELTDNNTQNNAITVGVIQNLNLTQQRRILKFFEYGNDEYQMVTGKPRINMSINRVLFDGPSILKHIVYGMEQFDFKDHERSAQYEILLSKVANRMGKDEFAIRDLPGTSDFWINLTSEVFDKPLGVFINIKHKMPNGHLQDYGGIFLENCLVSNHNLTLSAQNRIMVEQLQMEVGKPIPLGKYTGDEILKIERLLKERF